MKLQIRDETKEDEQKLEFYLTQNPKGDIQLRVGDVKDPDGWYVATITTEGIMILHSGLKSLDFFKLDENNCIKTRKE